MGFEYAFAIEYLDCTKQDVDPGCQNMAAQIERLLISMIRATRSNIGRAVVVLNDEFGDWFNR